MGATLTGISAILQNQPSGRWIAVSHDKVIADADTPYEVMEAAEREGESNPIVIRIPDAELVPPAQSTDEPPYDTISDKWEAGLVVPFVGSGASLMRQPEDAEWHEDSPFLPNSGELSKYLATRGGLPRKLQRDLDLAKISSYFCGIKGDRTGLVLALRRALARTVQPGRIHSYIAGLEQSKLIITTNYDTLLEQAFRNAGRDYDLLVYPADWNGDERGVCAMWREHGRKRQYLLPWQLEQLIDFKKATRPIIYKMHGSIGEEESDDHFVISEEDYLRFLSRVGDDAAIPDCVLAYLRPRSLLFLGYSLRDWNLRLVLYNLKGVVRDPFHQKAGLRRSEDDDKVIKSWAIQRRPNEVDKKLWEARGVAIFDQDVQEFALKMSSLHGGAAHGHAEG